MCSFPTNGEGQKGVQNVSDGHDCSRKNSELMAVVPIGLLTQQVDSSIPLSNISTAHPIHEIHESWQTDSILGTLDELRILDAKKLHCQILFVHRKKNLKIKQLSSGCVSNVGKSSNQRQLKQSCELLASTIRGHPLLTGTVKGLQTPWGDMNAQRSNAPNTSKRRSLAVNTDSFWRLLVPD